jgi:hypothetical protein
MALLKQPNPDPATIGRMVLDMKTFHDQTRAKQMDFEKQLSEVLNPSQRQVVDNLRDQAPTFRALRRLGFIGRQDFEQGPGYMSTE